MSQIRPSSSHAHTRVQSNTSNRHDQHSFSIRSGEGNDPTECAKRLGHSVVSPCSSSFSLFFLSSFMLTRFRLDPNRIRCYLLVRIPSLCKIVTHLVDVYSTACIYLCGYSCHFFPSHVFLHYISSTYCSIACTRTPTHTHHSRPCTMGGCIRRDDCSGHRLSLPPFFFCVALFYPILGRVVSDRHL